jgi:predicted ABC-type ATPase
VKLFIKQAPERRPDPPLYLDEAVWNEWLGDLEKAFPVGTVRTWQDRNQYMKQGPGIWVRVRGKARPGTQGPIQEGATEDEIRRAITRRSIARITAEYNALPAETRKGLQRLWVRGTHFGLPAMTVNRHARKIPGEKSRFGETKYEFTHDRKLLHDRWVREALASTDTPPLGEAGAPLAIVMMGGGGSGKGSIKARAIAALGHNAKKDFVNLDADDIKEMIPEYLTAMHLATIDGKKVTAKNAAWMGHAESSHVVDEMLTAAMKADKNVIVDGTGAQPGRYATKIKALKEMGYTVKIVYAHVEKSIAIKRAKLRAQENGRYVPVHILHDAHNKIPRNWEYLKSLADSHVQYYSAELPSKGTPEFVPPEGHVWPLRAVHSAPIVMQSGPPPTINPAARKLVAAFNQRVHALGGPVGLTPEPPRLTPEVKPGLSVAQLNERVTQGTATDPEKPIPDFDGRGGIVQVDPEYVEETKAYLDGLPDDIVTGGLQVFGKPEAEAE